MTSGGGCHGIRIQCRLLVVVMLLSLVAPVVKTAAVYPQLQSNWTRLSLSKRITTEISPTSSSRQDRRATGGGRSDVTAAGGGRHDVTAAGDGRRDVTVAGDGRHPVTDARSAGNPGAGPGRSRRHIATGRVDSAGGRPGGERETRAGRAPAPADPISFMMQSPDSSSNMVFYEAPEKEEAPCKTGGFSVFTLINFAIAAVNVANNILNNNNNNNNNNNDRNNNNNNVNVADNNNNGNNLNMIDLGGALGRRRRVLLETHGDLDQIRDAIQDEAVVLEVMGFTTTAIAHNRTTDTGHNRTTATGHDRTTDTGHNRTTATGHNRTTDTSSTRSRRKRNILLESWRAAERTQVTEVMLGAEVMLESWRAAERAQVTEVMSGAEVIRQLTALFRLTSEVSSSLPARHALVMKHLMLLTLDLWEGAQTDSPVTPAQKTELKNCILSLS